MKYNKVIISDAEPVCQNIKDETVVLSSNGITNGDVTEEINGTGLVTSRFM